jgi:hypothetical protein
MSASAIKIAVVCFAAAILLFNKPLGRMTASWQRMIGLGTAANETVNRVCYLAVAVISLALAIWAN